MKTSNNHTQKSNQAIFALLDTPAFGGAEQYMLSHLRFLCQQGYHIVLATNNEKVKQEFLARLTPEEEETFHIIKAPYRLDAIGNWKGLVKFFLSLPRALFWCYSTIQRLQKEYEQVICLWPGFSDRLAFSPIARHFACPLIWIEIGPLEPTFKKNWGFPRFLYRLSEKYVSSLVTISLFTKQSILKNTHFKASDMTLVYPGTHVFSEKDVESFKKKSRVWKKKKHLENKTLFGVVARLAHENEIAMVIRGFYLYLNSRHPGNHSASRISYVKDSGQARMTISDTILLIIGDGPVRGELEALVEQLGITEQVRFCGFVSEEEKRVILSGCSLFIFPRAWELDGFGMTTIEAMALGVPVLTTDFGPQIEIVTDGREGYKYIPHDSEDLAKKMRKMMEVRPLLRNAMSKKARERVVSFSWKQSHDKMYHVVQSFS